MGVAISRHDDPVIEARRAAVYTYGMLTSILKRHMFPHLDRIVDCILPLFDFTFEGIFYFCYFFNFVSK